MLVGDETEDQPDNIARRRPGSACAECRRRKLRCDGRDSQCENCFIAGVPCVISAPSGRRGPKKGHIKTLQTRIANLESRLMAAGNRSPVQDDQSLGTSDPPTIDMLLQSFQPSMPGNNELVPAVDLTVFSPPASSPLNIIQPWDISPSGAPDIAISELTRADLILRLCTCDRDQLYFDRVHLFAPILHHNRYLSWCRDAAMSQARQCLQYAMWAMAASMSVQLEHLRDSLYRHAVHLLESPNAREVRLEFYHIEHVQASLIVALYEFSRLTFHRGWMSAGQCFRLVQLMKLHEVDRAQPGIGPEEPAEEPEERRRAFWMAYILDRFISMRADHPLTFAESIIVTRLPVPEHVFQNNKQRPECGFLPEAFAELGSEPRCPLTDCILLATLCGRSISHRQQTAVEHSCDGLSDAFWERHRSLDALLAQYAHAVAAQARTTTGQATPVHLFNNLVAQAAILHNCRILESVIGRTVTHSQTPLLGSRQQAAAAAHETARFARVVSQLSYFKVHPLTPLPLILCAEFLGTQQDTDPSATVQLQEILQILDGLPNISNFREAWKVAP
ncbi:fungal-specific transcription factor domain-containing protein [Aspergillus cavernicola]|uniref:Fungal-specific transcription factor domain-containing protein n=1 Tax=Aspergillus cavernicola TaxID=176166 RepID=A0ABR4HCK9_9EURO